MITYLGYVPISNVLNINKTNLGLSGGPPSRTLLGTTEVGLLLSCNSRKSLIPALPEQPSCCLHAAEGDMHSRSLYLDGGQVDDGSCGGSGGWLWCRCRCRCRFGLLGGSLNVLLGCHFSWSDDNTRSVSHRVEWTRSKASPPGPIYISGYFFSWPPPTLSLRKDWMALEGVWVLSKHGKEGCGQDLFVYAAYL